VAGGLMSPAAFLIYCRWENVQFEVIGSMPSNNTVDPDARNSGARGSPRER